jgi:hypothetical protein
VCFELRCASTQFCSGGEGLDTRSRKRARHATPRHPVSQSFPPAVAPPSPPITQFDILLERVDSLKSQLSELVLENTALRQKEKLLQAVINQLQRLQPALLSPEQQLQLSLPAQQAARQQQQQWPAPHTAAPFRPHQCGPDQGWSGVASGSSPQASSGSIANLADHIVGSCWADKSNGTGTVNTWQPRGVSDAATPHQTKLAGHPAAAHSSAVMEAAAACGQLSDEHRDDLGFGFGASASNGGALSKDQWIPPTTTAAATAAAAANTLEWHMLLEQLY